ncbi:MAG: hypothetical protein KDA85_16840 [Planctomycetaceae bacterium]|nr:hypothetical protein [Planctomycetaceae bacterium]
MFRLFFTCIFLEIAYGRLGGDLVPAVAWGLFASEDDEDLKSSTVDSDELE